MNDLTIRPTVKFLRIQAILVLLVVLAAWVAFLAKQIDKIWLPAALSVFVVLPLGKWIRIQTSVTVLSADKLRSETGLFGKATHNLVLSRIQDVGVNQSLFQRMFDIGDVWIETAGAASRIMIENIDSPNTIAERILEASRHGN
jgi:uncharacterized membrane protein YdbT with pleckstrin-like domain